MVQRVIDSNVFSMVKLAFRQFGGAFSAPTMLMLCVVLAAPSISAAHD
jgi:hypothetical protein